MCVRAFCLCLLLCFYIYYYNNLQKIGAIFNVITVITINALNGCMIGKVSIICTLQCYKTVQNLWHTLIFSSVCGICMQIKQKPLNSIVPKWLLHKWPLETGFRSRSITKSWNKHVYSLIQKLFWSLANFLFFMIVS